MLSREGTNACSAAETTSKALDTELEGAWHGQKQDLKEAEDLISEENNFEAAHRGGKLNRHTRIQVLDTLNGF